ncbi:MULTISPECIES: telomere-associated protein Tap [Streptomyces]|uniref:Transcriptional regulator with XRE-family HTH domain n=1 Tax=Streptomyces clavifer TaxID=68188 RepID=A0ABS4VHX9_9ACTN|nr:MULTISPECIES: helix-turn-helix domain-containing protein [Streptomyces]MBP2363482.1 transcriptional regulator with XRE-family HTH domain [Streptomyces clavifer]MDX2748403.1 helix-turn-helix domain-containing protein [Streptomyces sp. NRRL_B-2557]RPK71764.1 Helix-turn-helix protein [Streptomyces sp. ADI97-07]GHB28274.1 transcriptional regulator [Streptomyces clavifer]
MSELFEAVDALIASASPLPPPAERERLRKAHGLTQAQVAAALEVRRPTVVSWESGKTEPRPPQREAYARLLAKLAQLYPAPAESTPTAPATFTGPSAPVTPQRPEPDSEPEHAVSPAPVHQPVRPTATSILAGTTRRPAAKKVSAKPATATTADPRFENGPLAVIDVEDGQVVAYCVGGLVLDVPAKSLPSLIDWTLAEAKLGAPRLSGPGKDADPLLVLTEAACERYGLPIHLTQEERLSGRLPEGHKVVKQLARAEWKLTKRGLGPWARIYRPAHGGRRACVQLCLPSWGALDTRTWGSAGNLPAADLARMLGTFASRVMTPRGSTAVTGLELMTALHPPTRASAPDADGKRHSEHNPGSLGHEPVDCAPCEAPDGHPLLKDLPRFHQRGPAEMLIEEAYDWARPLTDDEYSQRYLVGIDVNMAFAAGANGLNVGLDAPTHVQRPEFDPKLPGSWLVDLSHIELDERLPSPFTPKGDRPEGPAWYATPTVAYAVELGYQVAPAEAYVRYENGRYLDGWYNRLRDAYIATMADLGVTADLSPADFLTAMDGYRQRDPQMALVLSAVKATVKGGIGKLRERPRGEGWKPGEPWRALSRPTWRPDIRAAVISKTRINMHRKMAKHAAFTGQYPVAILSDCAVYTSDGPSPLDFLPYRQDKPLPGGFRLGVSPGMVKHEGTQTVLWAEAVREEHGYELNLARYIKDGQVTGADTGE